MSDIPELTTTYIEFSMPKERIVRVPEPKPETPVEREQRKEGFYPGRWWQAVEYKDGKPSLLAGTSEPEDFKNLELIGKPNVKFFRLFEKRDQNWVEEAPFQ